MSTVAQATPESEIEYPDDDGNPMSENTLQNDWMMTIKGGLIKLFRNNPNVFTACDLLWYPVRGEPTIRTAPDAMVAFDRPKGRRGSYKQWEEANQPPHVVFEVLAPGNRPGEMERKFRFYDKYGVEEYYVYDPDDGSLEGWIRSQDRLEPVPQMAGHVSPRLGIRFEPGQSPENLTIINPDGSRFLTWEEECDRLDAVTRQVDMERERAEIERERVDGERARADAAQRLADEARLRADEQGRQADEERRKAGEERLRAERLAARLRELGIDPD